MSLQQLVRWCISNAWLVVIAALLLAGVGIATVETARYDVFPEFVPAQATVQTEAPGLVAEQVESLVTRPIENAINGANGVETVRSESVQGLSVINVTFREGEEPFRARQVVTEAVAQAAPQLPASVAAPVVTPLTSSTMDLLKIGLTSEKLSPMELRNFAETVVRPRLLATQGVARAIVFGGEEPRYEIRIRPGDIIARGLAISDVANALSGMTAIRGGGFVDTASQRILVQPALGKIDRLALASTPIAVSGGPSITIGDVADVIKAPAPQFGDALVMGKPGVLIAMSSQYGANTLDATHAVEATIDDLKPAFVAQGIKLQPSLHRPANFIEAALAGISLDMIIGSVMILFVLFAFLRDVRVAIIAFISIPLSLLTALIVLDRLGSTINTMTLGGLAVALGVVVDDAVVGVENIVRRLRLNHDGDPAPTIADATVEVRAPVVYATYVLALTIAPILFLTGLQGAFFSPLALAFLLAVVASLVVAITVTPALAALLLRKVAPHDEPRFLIRAKAWHRNVLERIALHPNRVVAATALVGVLSLAALWSFGAELLPAFRERHYVLQVRGPSGASLGWMRQIGIRLSHDLLAIPEVATVEQQIGRAESGEDTFPPNASEFHVELKPGVGGASEDRALEEIRAAMARYPGLQTEAVTFLGDRIGESLSGETAAVAISIYGQDLGVLDRTATQIASVLGKVAGAADVAVKAPPGAPLLKVRLDPQRMGLRGIAPGDAFDAIETAFQGLVVAQINESNRTTDVVIALPPEMRGDPEAVASLLVRSADGTTARLDGISDIALADGRSTIVHQGGQRLQVVTANPTRSDIRGFVNDAQTDIAKHVKLPAGVSISWGGVAEGQKASTRQLLINVAVAAIAVIGLLVLAFGGIRAATLILAGTPFALAGGAVAVALTGGVLSLGALVGFVTLFGIAARNAILLVAHTDHLIIEEGLDFGLTTVLLAAEERVTPILMTALVTALGLIPLAIEAGQSGREVQGPMAIVILGGLVTSTAMSLMLLPALILQYLKPSITSEGAG